MAPKKTPRKKNQELTEKFRFTKSSPSPSPVRNRDTTKRLPKSNSPGIGKPFEPNRDHYRRYE